MRSARWVQTGLAGCCTVTVALPLLTLFAPASWLGPVVLTVAFIAVVGGVLRRWSGHHTVIVPGQIWALALSLHVLFLLEDTWYGIPTWSSLGRVPGLLTQAFESVQTSSAPVPLVPGATFCITVLVGVVAIGVDHVAVTRHAPAAAGIPLLAAYLASASNSGTGLQVRYFLLAGLAYLALLGEDGLSALRRWGGFGGTSFSLRRADPTGRFGTAGRTMGALAIAAGIILPAVLPHADPTFLASGLGRNRVGPGGGITLDSTLDLTRNLNDRSSEPVLRYTTTARDPQPLRIGVLDHYEGGQWRPSTTRMIDTGGIMPTPVGTFADSQKAKLVVTENNVRSPQLAMPPNPIAMSLDPAQWRLDLHETYRATQHIERYDVEFLQPEPTAADFPDQLDASPDATALLLDGASATRVAELHSEIIPVGASPLESAWAIQSYLRGPEFSYSLELAPPVSDPTGAPADDPLSQFLLTKQGYCIQFATAMVMMSRERGIPARMVIGYLPGSYRDGAYTVVAADAHAWPELWFPGLGWVRFEPTPSARSGTAPAWSARPVAVPNPSVAPTSSGATPSPTTRPRDDIDVGAAPVTTTADPLSRVATWLGANWLMLTLILVGALAVLAVPAGSWLDARRARRRARNDAERVEAQWHQLMDQLTDLGVPPEGSATPRQAGAQLVDRAALATPDAAAMARVVATLERARYAAADGSELDMQEDADTVRRAVSARRRRRVRVTARLWPRSGVRYWRRALAATIGRPRRAWRMLRRKG